ncbi:MAG TPA: Ig-like domain-containing protein [Pyrinomonadaceae bacterium]|nr:Ig-like domain-containing protein [Pyrinomonadaceae bacterium]
MRTNLARRIVQSAVKSSARRKLWIAGLLALAVAALPVGLPLFGTLTAQAATFRTRVAQVPQNPTDGQTVRIWMNSDTAFGETACVEYQIGNTFTKVLGTFDDTGFPGANWRADIPGQPAGTTVQYQLFTRNEVGSDYGFTGFNWSYTVAPTNNVPVASASPNPATTNEDTSVQITLTGTDADDQTLFFVITDQPDHGALIEETDSICSPPGSPAICMLVITYRPAADYNGADSFKFVVSDGTANSAEATVNINVTAVADLRISDVTQAEGNTGQTTFRFTVSLDSPAPAGGVTFQIATQDGTATDADNDYEPNSATGATISEGQQEYLFDVAVNGDTAVESNETFNVNVTNATNATIADGQGTGTILNDDGTPSAGQVIISEFRLRGAGADSANDEFIEIYNNTDEEMIVRDSSPLPDINPDGWAVVSSDAPTTPKHVIPAGTRIPARGHYLVVNTIGYSLGLYPSGHNGSAATTAIEDGGYNVDIPDNAGIALFRTSNPLLLSSPTERLDAVGFTVSPIFAETTPLQPSNGINIPLQHSFVRRMTTGRPQDTDNNQADFDFVAVEEQTVNGRTPLLGAPGPENLTSPTERNAVVKGQLVDPQCGGFGAATTACARVRTAAGANPTNAAFGTLLIRRRFRNTSGTDVTRLRFRLVDVTAGTPQTAGVADLRALTSVDVTVQNTQGFDVLLHGLTLEEVSSPTPTQPRGGGLNSTLSADVTLAQPLKPNVPYDVEFRLGVMQNGAFRFLVNVEALPPASPAPAATGGSTIKTPREARGKQ